MLIDKVSPVCEIVFNFIQFPSATRATYVLPSCPYSPPFGTGERKEKITWYCFLGNSVQGFPSYFRKLRHEKGCRSLTQTHKLGWIIQSGFSKKKFEIGFFVLLFFCKKELNLQIFRLMIWLQKLVYICWDIIKDYLILEECNNQSKLLSNSTQNWPNIVQNQSKKCQYCFKSDIIGHKVYSLQSQTHKSKATYSFIDLKISRYLMNSSTLVTETENYCSFRAWLRFSIQL